VKCFAYPDHFITQGSIDELMQDNGVSVEAVASYIKNIL
jgi:hypothetical protein